jgi:PAS domain S-box-containing protein
MSASATSPTLTLRVLLIEDSETDAALLLNSLRRGGFDTVSERVMDAASLTAALEEKDWDLIIADYSLPRFSAPAALKLVRESELDVPFIVVSGVAGEETAVAMMKAGAHDYLTKDRLERLVPAVERELGEVRVRRERAEAEAALRGSEEQIRQLNASLERKVIERTAALHRSEQALAAFFDHAPIGLLWVESDGRILRVNQSMWEMLGFTEDEMLGHPISGFDTSNDLSAVLATLLEVGLPAQNHRARLRAADGSHIHVLVDAIAVWEDGRLIRSEWFVRDITRRIELEREILIISEREQRRFGQDLHDDLCQTLAAIRFRCDSLASEFEKENISCAEPVREIAAMLAETTTHAREMARGLSPMRLNPENLPESLEELAVRTYKTFRIECEFDCRKSDLVCDEAVGVHLYRIAQEAVANAVKHGEPKRILISLTATPSRIVLAIRDDGKGMPPNADKSKGMGLRVMQYRSGIIGGSLAVHHLETGGTEVVCTVKI